MSTINPSEFEAISRARQLVMGNLAKGEVSRSVLDYLLDNIDPPHRIVAYDIAQNGGPLEPSVPPHMAKLREQLLDLFDFHPEGRACPIRTVLMRNDAGNYAMVRERNVPPSDFLSKFWFHHFSPNHTQVIYPELDCGCLSSSVTPLMTEQVDNRRGHSDVADALDAATLSRGRVSTASVRTLLRLLKTFAIWQAPLSALAVPRTTRFVEGNLIVLGSPCQMPFLLPLLEAAANMKTGCRGIVVTGGKDPKLPTWYEDTAEDGTTPQGTELTKRVVVTRHHYQFQRTLTVVAGKDDLAVEAVVRVLTDELALLMLARELGCRESFPNHFQALFSLRMVKGHPDARDIRVERVVELETTRK